MDVKKFRTTTSIVTRNIANFDEQTGNIYETIAMLSKRSNQISTDLKKELHRKIDEFASVSDSMEEIFENREQIEIVKYYEQLPKPVLIAIQEYLNKELYYRNPEKEKIAAQCAAAESEEQNTVVENTDTVVAE
ncbi:MAG: DNA-directed RNA polymerase subunit omega [Bacteroidales bacterium]|jgi:DNA-directed RNA polymerase subunit K/omega|nr:DNA-directed RNA polymerase subunit omega [Bacteroidales bacterium]